MFKDFKKQPTKTKIFMLGKIILPVFLGAIAGYAYYYYIGCVSGHCPITSNPYISTAYGSAVGALFIRWKDKSK